MTGTERYIATVRYLDGLFAFFNEKLFKGELPRPVITVQYDERNTRSGWCTRSKVWKGGGEEAYEINVSAQGLSRPIMEIAADLLHEMCHYYARLRGLKEVNSTGRYHNKLFKHICETHGLNAEELKGKGYAKTSLTCEKGNLLKEYMDKNPPGFIHRIPETKGLPVRVKTERKYICPICGCKVRAGKAVNIICGDCGSPYGEEILNL